MILAWVYQMTRPPRCFCGTVLQPQLATPLVILAKPAGMRNSGLESRPPASMQQDLDRRIGAETVRQHAARRAAADDDEVISHGARPSEIGLGDVIGDAQRLGGDGQRGIDRGRGRQK